MPVISPPMRNEIHRGQRWAKSLAGLTTLAAMFVASVAMHSESIATTSTTGFVNFAEHDDRIPDRLAVDDGRRAGDGDADERKQRHRRRQAERLAEHLVALRVGVAAEVGDVERQRGPEADVGRQRRRRRTARTRPPSVRPRRTSTAARASRRSRPAA